MKETFEFVYNFNEKLKVICRTILKKVESLEIITSNAHYFYLKFNIYNNDTEQTIA